MTRDTGLLFLHNIHNSFANSMFHRYNLHMLTYNNMNDVITFYNGDITENSQF